MENIESYFKLLHGITSPEDRFAYYCKHINSSAIFFRLDLREYLNPDCNC